MVQTCHCRSEQYMMTNRCTCCSFFKNDPALIEMIFPGLNSLSSAYSSVRAESGICDRHELFISSRYGCTLFEPVRTGKKGSARDRWIKRRSLCRNNQNWQKKLKKMAYEPMLPVENKLVAWSIGLGVVLLGLLVWISYTYFSGQH